MGLNTNITHGDLKVSIRHGSDPTALIGLALLAVVAYAAVIIIETYMWWIIAATVTAGAGWLYARRRKAVAAAARAAAIAESFAREHQARAVEAAETLAAQRQHELAVAAVMAPQVHITNTIDPAAILAAAFGAVQYQPEPARVVRAEVQG